METKVNALVLKAIDYKDNDKILTLLTAEKGKITAGIKGVKKAGAKLKFASQPFCFAEYVLSEKSGKYTVINASECESFYELRTDFDKLYPAFAVCEIANTFSYESDECKNVFYAAVAALTETCTGDAKLAFAKFVLSVLGYSGYALSLGDCAVCGQALLECDRLRFDMSTGTFACWECGDGVGVSGTTYNQLRKIAGETYIQKYLTDDGLKRAIKLLREYCVFKTDARFNALDAYIKTL